MTASRPSAPTPSKAFLLLPVGVRVYLARFTLWRRRITRQRGQRLGLFCKTTTSAFFLALLSGTLGYLLAGLPKNEAAAEIAAISAAQPEDGFPITRISEFPSATQWGNLQAEVMRLRLLFSRIVSAADLGGSEFALTVQLADDRYLESISELEDTPELIGHRFELAKRSIDHMTSQSELMLSITERRQKERKYTLSGSPVVRARITSRFGYRADPRSGRNRFHRGLDFAGPQGSKVLALADGVVTYSGKNGGYGNLVELEHTDGYRTRYAHNESNLVEVGGVVSKGQPIATMGSTGKSTGTHVHVEVRHQGRPIDPLQFISAGW